MRSSTIMDGKFITICFTFLMFVVFNVIWWRSAVRQGRSNDFFIKGRRRLDKQGFIELLVAFFLTAPTLILLFYLYSE